MPNLKFEGRLWGWELGNCGSTFRILMLFCVGGTLVQPEICPVRECGSAPLFREHRQHRESRFPALKLQALSCYRCLRKKRPLQDLSDKKNMKFSMFVYISLKMGRRHRGRFGAPWGPRGTISLLCRMPVRAGYTGSWALSSVPPWYGGCRSLHTLQHVPKRMTFVTARH